MKQNEITLGRFLRILLVAIAIVVTYIVLESLSGVLLPFAIAWLLAYMLNPLVNFMQNKLRLKYRALSIVAALLSVALVIYGLVMLVLPAMFSEIYALKNITLSFLGQNINDGSIPEPVVALFNDMSERYGFAEVLQRSDDTGLLTILVERAKNVMLGTLSLFGQVMTFSLIMLYLFFMLLDFERISKSWRAYVPRKWRGVMTKLWDDLVYGMNQYFRGQALVALCVGVLFSLGFILIDFPAAIAFGMFIGLLNMVPYLQVVSLFPMALLAMLKASNTGGGFWPIMLSAIAVMCVVQLIQDLFLVPKIMGKRMNLHPATILLSLSIWGHLLGVLGMIVALPLTTLLLAYIRRFHEIAETSDKPEEHILKQAIDSAVVKNEDNEKEDEPEK